MAVHEIGTSQDVLVRGRPICLFKSVDVISSIAGVIEQHVVYGPTKMHDTYEITIMIAK